MADSAPLPGVEKPPSSDALRTFCYSDPEFAKRYQGWEPIGQGAFATVVKVSLMGQPVALKIFTSMTDERRARLRAEFASTLKLTSPHLVRTYSAFENGSIAWIEMEAVDGPNLEEELSRRTREATPFTLAEALDIAIAVTSVVAEAHQEGIVHRDIKTANILLPRSRRPVAKLGDFGIARLAGGMRLTAAGAFAGTPRWGAPEAFAGKEVGAPADIYSLSLCLFALFTDDRFPWVLEDDSRLESLVNVHVKKPPLRMSYFVPSIPRELDALVTAGLAKSPPRRPAASEMLRGLKSIRESQLSSVVERSADARPPRRARGRVLAAIVVAIVTAMAVVRLSHNRIVTQRDATDSVRAPRPGLTARAVSPRRATPMASGDGASSVAAPEAAVPAEDRLQVSVREGFVRLRNGPARLRRIEVVLMNENGAKHLLAVPGVVGPFETVDVAIEAFAPRPSPAARFRQALVRAVGGGEAFEGTYPLRRTR